MSTRQETIAFLRQDFHSFIIRSFMELYPETEFLDNWHLEVIANALEDCRLGLCKRLIINVPPRSLKSHCATVAFVAWLLGHNPSAQIICASYAQDLSDKHALDCRNLMLSPFYQEIFATRLSGTRPALADFRTTQNGVRFATSVGGVLTGRGGDFLIIDDPLKPDEAASETQRESANDWFERTAVSRLNDKKNGVIIVIMQRLHEDDLAGHLMQQGNWRQIRFPAIAEQDESFEVRTLDRVRTVGRIAGEALHPEREPLEILEAIRRDLGEYNFAGQYQQMPAPAGGGMVKTHWFLTYSDVDKPEKFNLIFQSWDTANKVSELNDYCVCTTWGLTNKKKLYLLHVLRRRMEYPELKRRIVQHAAEFSAQNVVIEDRASGTQLIQDLIQEGFPGVVRYPPKLDKVLRLHSVTNMIENGQVYLPAQAEWLRDYLNELITFPNCKFDDQADSTSQALDWAKTRAMVPGIILWTAMENRKYWISEGRWDKVKELDDKYGVPPERFL